MRFRFWPAVLAALALSPLLIAACGGDDDDTDVREGAATATLDGGNGDDAGGGESEDDGDGASSGDTVRACDLLTADDVEAALPGSVEGPFDDEDLGFGTSCSYEIQEPHRSIVLQVFKPGDEDLARANYESVSLGEEEAVGGLGDEARWFPEFGSLRVLRGTYDIDLQVASSQTITELDDVRQMMETVLDRLP